MNKLIGLLFLMGSLPIAAHARGQSVLYDPAQSQDFLIHKIFRTRIFNFDRLATETLGFTPLWCRLVETIPPAKNAPAGTLPTRKVVFRSRYLGNCLFERMKAGMKNGAYRGIVEADIDLSGPPDDDSLRTIKIDWRSVEIGNPDEGFFSRWSHRLLWPVALVHYSALASRFLNSFMSSDVYIEFNKPVKMSAFEVPAWVEPLIVGDPQSTAITRMEFHTAQMQVDKTNPYRMRALVIAYNAAREKQLALDLKLNWGIFHQSGLVLELGGH